MFSQSHQQEQHGRVNGGTSGRRIPIMDNYHQSSHHQLHTQHHQSLQQEHSGHSTNEALIGNQSGYSSSLLSPSFTPSNLQDGNSAARGAQPQQVSEHWAEQLKLHKESGKAHVTMTEQHAPHYYARLKAADNLPLETTNVSPSITQDGETEELGQPTNLDGAAKRQDWHSIDLSGQGVRVLALPLFSFAFLTELYLASNKIGQLPAAIGQLRHLKHLDASNNQLTELPPELGMCVYMKNLLLFDNSIRTLPNELGYLYQLETLGIEGNPLDVCMKQEIVERGTKSLIHHLREQAPGTQLVLK
jgi:CCR4-NOT transcription complex subunit 6